MQLNWNRPHSSEVKNTLAVQERNVSVWDPVECSWCPPCSYIILSSPGSVKSAGMQASPTSSECKQYRVELELQSRMLLSSPLQYTSDSSIGTEGCSSDWL